MRLHSKSLTWDVMVVKKKQCQAVTREQEIRQMLLCVYIYIYIYKFIPKSLLFKCECLDKKFIAIGTDFDFKSM